MKYTFVIEDEPKFFQDVKEALGEIDPSMEVRNYANLEGFVEWIRSTIEKKRSAASQELPAEVAPPQNSPPSTPAPAAKPEEDKDESLELVMLICKSEFLKHKGFTLLQKTREYLITRGICTREAPTVFVLTAFDTENFDYSKYENQIVSNIVFKPFDKLVLKSHLRIALAGGKPQKSEELYSQKTQSRIEMLKDVQLEEMSETGFVTSSDRAITLGAMAKYYSRLFQSGRLSSLYARAIKCDPHPSDPKMFRCEFTFYNIVSSQVSVIRRAIKIDKKYKSVELKPPQVTREVNVVTIAPKDSGSLDSSLQSSFKNIKFITYNDFLSFAYEVDPTDSRLNTSKTKDKPLPFQHGKVFFDVKVTKIVGMDPAPTDTAMFLGLSAKSVVDKDSMLHSRVFSDDRNKWIQFLKQEQKLLQKPLIFRFRMQDEKIVFLKCISFQKVKHDKLGEVFQLEIAECSEVEKKDFLMSLSQLPNKIDAIFIDRVFVGESPAERWKIILELLKDRAPAAGIKLFVMSGSEVNTEDLIEKQAPFDDIFVRPFDAPFITKRIKQIIPDLRSKEPMDISSREYKELIKAAQPVKAIEISESGLAIDYYRAIPVGNFRKVVLWMPHEIGLPEFLASCNSVEEIEENKVKRYICSFVFFGVRDDSLKHIRRWIKEYYVHTKEQES